MSRKISRRQLSRRAAVLANLGVALLQTGEGAEGLARLVQAAKLLPESSDIAHLLAANLQDIRVIPASLCLIAALSSFGPWGAYTMSQTSQRKKSL